MKAPVGQTRSAGYQAGARKTFDLALPALWRLVTSLPGQRALGATRSLNAASPGVTTFVPQSHYRRRVPEGLLQVRVLPAARGRSTLALHLERLADPSARADALEQLHAALEVVGELAPTVATAAGA